MRKKNNASFSHMLFRGALIHNPILVQVVGLCPVVAVSVNLKTAALLSGVFLPTIILTQVIACLFLKKLPRYLRISLYLLIGLAIICPLLFVIDQYDPSLRLDAGIFLPLLAVNSVTALHCEKLAVRPDVKLKIALYDAVATGVGFSVVFVLVGFLREFFGAGAVLGRPLPFSKMGGAAELLHLPALLLPFGSFLFLGFLAAGLRWITKHFFPAYVAESALKISQTAVPVRLEAESVEQARAETVTLPELDALADIADLADLPETEEDMKMPLDTPEIPELEITPLPRKGAALPEKEAAPPAAFHLTLPDPQTMEQVERELEVPRAPAETTEQEEDSSSEIFEIQAQFQRIMSELDQYLNTDFLDDK